MLMRDRVLRSPFRCLTVTAVLPGALPRRCVSPAAVRVLPLEPRSPATQMAPSTRHLSALSTHIVASPAAEARQPGVRTSLDPAPSRPAALQQLLSQPASPMAGLPPRCCATSPPLLTL
eukprot:COSAG06_NODE_1980_length_7926_cov_10.286061_9_plen_119_part_00